MPLQATSAAEREKQDARAETLLVATRAIKEQTRDRRKIYLDRFRTWLWKERGVSFRFLLEQKPADPERIAAFLVEYGKEMFAAGKSYGGIYLETVNVVAVERPIIRRQLTAAWDLAYAWLVDEPHQHHPAMPISVMIAMVVVALMWGWPYEAAVIMMAWAGIMRIGEILSATRAELILPGDAAPGTSFALVMIKMPKTRGRSAKHQAARIDQEDVVTFLAAVYKDAGRNAPLWPFSASTLRKRSSCLLEALQLPSKKLNGVRPFDLGSMRPGGATWLLHATEDSELVRRRGRWLSQRVMEVYLQEAFVATFLEKISPGSRSLIGQCSGAFEMTLNRTVAFLQSGIPPPTWFYLLRGNASAPSKKAGKMG